MTIKEKIQFVENWINENEISDKAFIAGCAWEMTNESTSDEDYNRIYDYIINYGY